jgi:hypothetical protein
VDGVGSDVLSESCTVCVCAKLCAGVACACQIINCFEMSDHDGKAFATSNDPLRPCYSGCFTPEFYPRCRVS